MYELYIRSDGTADLYDPKTGNVLASRGKVVKDATMIIVHWVNDSGAISIYEVKERGLAVHQVELAEYFHTTGLVKQDTSRGGVKWFTDTPRDSCYNRGTARGHPQCQRFAFEQQDDSRRSRASRSP